MSRVEEPAGLLCMRRARATAQSDFGEIELTSTAIYSYHLSTKQTGYTHTDAHAFSIAAACVGLRFSCGACR